MPKTYGIPFTTYRVYRIIVPVRREQALRRIERRNGHELNHPGLAHAGDH